MNSSSTSLLMVLGLWVGLALLCATPARNGTGKYFVTYEVLGSGTRSASLTYTNEQGGTEQAEVVLPWKKTFGGRYGEFLYLSAQNKEGDGSITVHIIVNNKTLKTSSSYGGYTIATASDRCCQ